MSTAKKLGLVSVKDYLAGELASPIKHEYVEGRVYAMGGFCNAHNLIATNISGVLHGRLRGKPCQLFNSATKIHIQDGQKERFYYPDASVVCPPNPQTDSFQDNPVVVFEVLSCATRRFDMGEKKDAYLEMQSLDAYVLIEQDSPAVVTFRRTKTGFIGEVHEGLDAILPLPEIGIDLPLAEIYETVEFAPEPEQDEA